MLVILIKAYCVNAVVDIKPIYLNKRYLFQDKIYYLNKIYFCFAKIKFSKHTLYKQKQPPEVFYKKSVLRDFTKFTGKHLCQSLSFNKVAGLSSATFLKKRLAQVFSCEFYEIFKNNFFTEHFWTASKLNWSPD